MINRAVFNIILVFLTSCSQINSTDDKDIFSKALRYHLLIEGNETGKLMDVDTIEVFRLDTLTQLKETLISIEHTKSYIKSCNESISYYQSFIDTGQHLGEEFMQDARKRILSQKTQISYFKDRLKKLEEKVKENNLDNIKVTGYYTVFNFIGEDKQHKPIVRDSVIAYWDKTLKVLTPELIY